MELLKSFLTRKDCVSAAGQVSGKPKDEELEPQSLISVVEV